MGKKQHSKDRMYLTASEWKYEGGGFKPDKSTVYAPLEFDRCAISFQPFQTPVSTIEGSVFDIVNILPFMKQYGVNPCTGTPLKAKHLIRLHFKKNTQGEYCDPVTYKIFSPHTHIVFIKQTGNVYAMETIEELNYKAKNLNDLLSGEPFQRHDVITIQDPKNPARREVKSFYHTRLDLIGQDDKKASIQLNETARKTLEELEPGLAARVESQVKDKNAPVVVNKLPAIVEDPNALRAKDTDKRYAASFTSTTLDPFTSAQKRILTEQEILQMRYKQLLKGKKDEVGEKAFLRIVTNAGNLNMQLDVDRAPKTCHNFLLLAKRGYYNNVIFHRLIKGFMIQGGDPTGTGQGGESAWGGKFNDEISPHLSHDARGILSMANAGKNTNGSQFFITFAPCEHLDGKHTIFGRVVGGMDVLVKLERWECGQKGVGPGARFDKDRPTEEIRIMEIQVFKDPFDAPFVPDEDLKKKKEEVFTPEQQAVGQWFSAPQPMNIPAVGTGISRFLDAAVAKESDEERKKRLRKERKAKKGSDTSDLDFVVEDSSKALFVKRAKQGGDFSNF